MPNLTANDAHTRHSDDGLPRVGESFALTGPTMPAEPGHLPVRGDLAHVALAGRCFVPHYAVPMPHRVSGAGAVLHKLANGASEALATLAAGSQFDVLDISGSDGGVWAWGQVATPGGTGAVGYVPLTALERVD